MPPAIALADTSGQNAQSWTAPKDTTPQAINATHTPTMALGIVVAVASAAGADRENAGIRAA
jgi:hypothetical protein